MIHNNIILLIVSDEPYIFLTKFHQKQQIIKTHKPSETWSIDLVPMEIYM